MANHECCECVERLTRERDKEIHKNVGLQEANEWWKGEIEKQRARTDAAEAERDRLAEALQRIAENWRDDDHASLAAAALKREEKS